MSINLNFYMSMHCDLCIISLGLNMSSSINNFSSNILLAFALLCDMIFFLHILRNFHLLNFLKKLSSLMWL